MRLMRYRPLGLAGQLHGDLDRWFDTCNAIGARRFGHTADWTPAVDIRENEERFLVQVDLPGIDPDAIEITMERGTLTIQGERQGRTDDEGEEYRRSERVSGRFSRSFSLPETADAEGITARYDRGILELTIPKQATDLPRRINVEAA